MPWAVEELIQEQQEDDSAHLHPACARGQDLCCQIASAGFASRPDSKRHFLRPVCDDVRGANPRLEQGGPQDPERQLV